MTRPKIIKQPQPDYPEEGRAAHLNGSVVLDSVITRDGCVTALQIVRGFIPSFNRAALLAASQWQFSPALMDGVPVAVGYQITINFKVK